MDNYKHTDFQHPGRDFHSKAARVFGCTFLGVVFAGLFALVFGFLIKWLWNWLMPGIFGLGEIGYWQAVGLVILTKLLFGSFGHKSDQPKTRTRGHFHSSPYPGSFCEWENGVKDRFRKRNYYKQYWEDEGKNAFREYIERMEKNGNQGGSHEA